MMRTRKRTKSRPAYTASYLDRVCLSSSTSDLPLRTEMKDRAEDSAPIYQVAFDADLRTMRFRSPYWIKAISKCMPSGRLPKCPPQ